MNLSAELQNELNLIVDGKKPSKEAIMLIVSFDFELLRLQRSGHETNKEITTAITQIGGAKILLNCMKVLSKDGTRHNTKDKYRLYYFCYQAIQALCVNASDLSLEFCDQCGECGLLDFFAYELRNWKDKFIEDPKMFYELVDGWFVILMNCSKSPNNTQILQNLDVVPLAIEYLEIIRSRKLQNLTELKMDCSILLAHTMDEEDFHQMGDLNEVIEYLVQNLHVALSEPDHRSSGYCVDELIFAIQKFANNEKNGLKIIKDFNQFGIFSVVAGKGFLFKGKEKLSILSLLCQLSFLTKLRKKITENRTIMQFLQKTIRIESNRNNKEKQMAKLTLFVLKSKGKKIPDRSQGESSAPKKSGRTENIKQVVLSFEKESQNLAEQIKSDLKSNFPGCDVYLEGDGDYSDESLSANEVKTFQQSDASLLLLTKRYQNSLHCRAVAECLTSSTTRKTILLFENRSLTSDGWIKSILDNSENLECIEMKELFNYKVKSSELLSQIQKSLSGIVQKHIEQPSGDDEIYFSDNVDDFEDDDSVDDFEYDDSDDNINDNDLEKTFGFDDSENNGIALQKASLNESCPSTSLVKQSNTSVKKHIMISYQHSYQYLAEQIRDLLKDSGYKVWMDKNDMKGNIFDAMIDAIENSEFFIMCWSEEYQRSKLCRNEANYAERRLSTNRLIPLIVQKGYRPSGWIDFIFGSLLYYKISGDYDKTIHSTIVERLEKERQKE